MYKLVSFWELVTERERGMPGEAGKLLLRLGRVNWGCYSKLLSIYTKYTLYTIPMGHTDPLLLVQLAGAICDDCEIIAYVAVAPLSYPIAY
jgi:hypothetical protein